MFVSTLHNTLLMLLNKILSLSFSIIFFQCIYQSIQSYNKHDLIPIKSIIYAKSKSECLGYTPPSWVELLSQKQESLRNKLVTI